jgi:hypothetical protein
MDSAGFMVHAVACSMDVKLEVHEPDERVS